VWRPHNSFFWTCALDAQQDAQITLTCDNGMYYNPAFAGKQNGFRFSALSTRSQCVPNYTTSSRQGGATRKTQKTDLLLKGRVEAKELVCVTIVNDQIASHNKPWRQPSSAVPTKNKASNTSLGLMQGCFQGNQF